MSEEHKTKKIEEMNQKLSALKEQNDRLNFEMKGWIEKRDKLNQQFRDLRSEILKLKGERDKLNEKVKDLKQQRDDARERSQEIVTEMRELSQKIIELNRGKPSRAYQTLQKDFENIEWKIQTTSLSLQEEKKLVEQVKQLETELKCPLPGPAAWRWTRPRNCARSLPAARSRPGGSAARACSGGG